MKSKKGLKIAIIIIVAIIVLSITFVGVGVAAVKAWESFIEKAAYAEFADPLLECLPDGENFVEVDISDYDLPVTVTHVYTEDNGGFVVRLLTSGYGDDMVILCGVNASGEIVNAQCISSYETLGIEKTYADGIGDKGLTYDTIDQRLDTVSGATITTSAYKNALKDALEAAIILSGGEIDLKTDEEIFADNLNEALPAAEGLFTTWFATESLPAIKSVYVADNGAGYVFGLDDGYIGVDSEGEILADVTDEVKTILTTSFETINSSALCEIDITGYTDMPKGIDKAYKTTSGNYVFELHTAGFGINGDHYYNPSGEFIYIKISVTADGTVIACETVSQAESEGIGSLCAAEGFYSQFNGKDENNYRDIDAISGATITTNGYLNGISSAFKAIEILEQE